MLNTKKGIIYATFVGDALGTTYEFEHPKDIKIPERLNIVGKGPFRVAKGQITDDSEMTLALAYSIVRNKGFNKNDVAKSYIRWLESDPIDSGITTQFALSNVKDYKEAVKNSQNYNQKSLSNGFLMRISPLALIGLNLDSKKLEKIIKEEVKITHSNPIAYHIASLYINTIIYVAKGGREYKEKLKSLIKNKKFLEKEKILSIIENFEKTAYYSGLNGIKMKIHGTHMGFSFISLQIALYVLNKYNDYESAMRYIISLGGDTDTNCAIAGSLLGAKLGYKKIPKKWLETIFESKYNRPEEFKINQRLLNKLFKI